MSDLPPLGPGDLVLSDFDGTISLADTGLEMITRLELPAAWELEHQWRRGEISSRECLKAQWAMLQLPREQVEARLEEIPLDESFPVFVDLCRQRGVQLAILSDGLDFYIYRMLQRLSLQGCPGTLPLPAADGCLHVFANHAEWTPEGIRVDFPLAAEYCTDCGNCKTRELLALREGYRRVIYVGDGHSDMCPARHADLLFAKSGSHLAEFCHREGLACEEFRTFVEIAEALR